MTLENTGDAGTTITMDADRGGADQGIGSIVFKWNGTSVGQLSASSGADTSNKDDGDLTFSTTTSGGSLTERMRIDSVGNIKTSETYGNGLQNKIKQMGAFLQSSTHQSLALGY